MPASTPASLSSYSARHVYSIYRTLAMDGKFAYSTLPLDHIRLLYVSREDAGGNLYELQTFPLSSAPEFYALSYTWDLPHSSNNISLNESFTRIPANVDCALIALYNPPHDLALPIWIDAICINQSDVDEKGDQVRFMGEIYKKAREVIVWLGESYDDSDLAMDWIPRLSVALPSIAQPLGRKDYPDYDLPEESSLLWPALGHLYRRKWFGRLWVFQEVVLAAAVRMVCGDRTNDFDSFATVDAELNRLSMFSHCVQYQRLESHQDGFRAVSHMKYSKKTFAGYGGLPQFPTLLMIADTKVCSNPRDRVYGMLGLASRGFSDHIPVSYAEGSENAAIRPYIDCAKACIESYSMPFILQLVAGRERVPGLPSWCPNLSSDQGGILPFGPYLMAGVSPETTADRVIKSVSDSNILHITGFRVDIVSQVVASQYQWDIVADDKQIPRAEEFLKWEVDCLCLAQKATSSSHKIVPYSHIYAKTANTRTRLSKEQHENLGQAYRDIWVNVSRNAIDGGSSHPPPERRALYNDCWVQINRFSRGRRYFSTEKGMLGLGPPDIEKGDCVCVFYGGCSVFVLRQARAGENGTWFLKGDAFLHGAMELGGTPSFLRGSDEVFEIG